MNLIDGKALAAKIREEIKHRADALRSAGQAPGLRAVLVGDDPSALSYAESQAKQAAGVGIDYARIDLPADCTQDQAEAAIADLNADPAVHGILMQLPVPDGLDGFALQQQIAAAKDVEGVGAENLGLLAMGRQALAPCTAAAAFACLKSTGAELSGMDAVVVGRSVIVGKPLAMLLLGANATVTQCHTRTRDLTAHTRRADILIAAAGVAGLIGAEHVSQDTIVIDVGTHRVPSDEPGKKTRLIGDVKFDEVAPLARAITPVPGGVGPVTVAMLLSNTVSACEAGG